MKILTVGEFKAHFSEVLDDVRSGREVGVSYERRGQTPERDRAISIRKLEIFRDEEDFETSLFDK